jgi:diguanylate cyclase (GGDEF)-like protein/PAS domain S-box-containing protein
MRKTRGGSSLPRETAGSRPTREQFTLFGRRDRWLMLVLGSLMGMAAIAAGSWFDLQRVKRQFLGEAGLALMVASERMSNADTALISLASLYQASGLMSAKDQAAIATEILQSHDELLGMLHLRPVQGNERSAVEQELGAIGGGAIRLREPEDDGGLRTAGKRSSYLVVDFAAPKGLTSQLLGLDVLATAPLADAATRAIQTGRIARSGPILIAGEQRSYLLFRPIYHGYHIPGEPERRSTDLKAMAGVLVDLGRVFTETSDIDRNLRVSLGGPNASVTQVLLSKGEEGMGSHRGGLLPEFSVSQPLAAHGNGLTLTMSTQTVLADIRVATLLIALLSAIVLMLTVAIFYRSKRVARLQSLIAHSTLIDEKERAQVTLHSIADGVITTDLHGRVDYMNSVAAEMIGRSIQHCLGKRIGDLFQLVDEREGKTLRNPVDRCLTESTTTQVEEPAVMVRSDGKRIAVHDTAAPIHDSNGHLLGAVLVIRDVSRERQLTSQIEYQALHDELTGLINRRGFERELKNALEDTKRNRSEHALCYIDLDDFKIVNDTCGHSAGDELLRRIASNLQLRVRKNDILARLGGDEFGLLLRNCPLQRAEEIARGIRDEVRDVRFHWDDKLFTVGASIGVVSIDEYSEDMTEILSAADSACYIAKDLGRNRVHIFAPDDTKVVRRLGEMQWPQRIREALQGSGFLLYAQRMKLLQDDTEGEDIMEFLLRLRGDNEEIIPPGAFIPAAERYNLMRDIDTWVVDRAFELIAHEQTLQPTSRPRVYAINLSGQSLDDDEMAQLVRTRIQQFGVNPRSVCFEITETSAIANLSRATALMKDLRELGCRFALDDFGTGLSSFAYLKKLPVDYLKIDGEFVRDLLKDPVDRAMVETINNIGHVLRLKTIAESVESEATLEAVRRIGVDYAQGFEIAKPAPIVRPSR